MNGWFSGTPPPDHFPFGWSCAVVDEHNGASLEGMAEFWNSWKPREGTGCSRRTINDEEINGVDGGSVVPLERFAADDMVNQGSVMDPRDGREPVGVEEGCGLGSVVGVVFEGGDVAVAEVLKAVGGDKSRDTA